MFSCYQCILRFLHFILLYRAIIGEIDDEADASIDMANVKAEPLNAVVYWIPRLMQDSNWINLT